MSTIYIILSVILSILVIMFCTPITYKVCVQRDEYVIAKVYIRWIGKLLRYNWEYSENGESHREFYLGGKLRVGKAKDYQAWLSAKVEEELEDDSFWENDVEYPEKIDEHTREHSWEHNSIKGDTGVQLTLSDEGEVAEITPVIKECEEKDGCKIKEKVSSKKDECKDKTIHKEDKNDNDKENKGDKKESNNRGAGIGLLDVLNYVKDFSFWKAIFSFIHSLYMHSKPRYMHIEGTVGTGDPAYTAIIQGLVYSLFPSEVCHINFDYLTATITGTTKLKGKIYMPIICWYFLHFIMKKPIRKLIWMIIH